MNTYVGTLEIALGNDLPLRALTERLGEVFASLRCAAPGYLAAHILGEFVTQLALNDSKEAARKIRAFLLKTPGLIEQFDELLMYRNFQMAKAIAPYIAEKTNVLDVQTGNGFVAQMLAGLFAQRKGVRIATTDTKDRRHPFCRTLPWVDPNDVEKKGSSYDQLLFITVLHHCPDPFEIFGRWLQALRPGGTVIIIENTFPQGNFREEQINIFFDWFLNWVIHPSDYPTPFTHCSIEGWKKFFAENKCHLLCEAPLGEIAIVRVPHHLFLVQKT